MSLDEEKDAKMGPEAVDMNYNPDDHGTIVTCIQLLKIQC